MADLIILESPSKIHTVQHTLGNGYKVVACMGHVRDLQKTKLSVDIEHGFKPTYVNIAGKEKVIDDIKKLADKAEHVYIATDPDREGEAISWHQRNHKDRRRGGNGFASLHRHEHRKRAAGAKNPRQNRRI